MEYKTDLDKLRHSTSHIMAQAVQELWPETKVTIGPAIENGFYYDFDKSEPFSDSDLRKIEKQMKQILIAVGFISLLFIMSCEKEEINDINNEEISVEDNNYDWRLDTIFISESLYKHFYEVGSSWIYESDSGVIDTVVLLSIDQNFEEAVEEESLFAPVGIPGFDPAIEGGEDV